MGKQYIRCKGCENALEIFWDEKGTDGIGEISVCPKCSSVFCLYFSLIIIYRECDVLIHETLMNCPICLLK